MDARLLLYASAGRQGGQPIPLSNTFRERSEQVADAVRDIGKQAHCKVIDLYHNESLPLDQLVKYKRLKDPQTGQYRNYPYPDYIGVPFDPAVDEYPYPVEAMGLTYDGLHPSDRGDSIIAHALIRVLKKL